MCRIIKMYSREFQTFTPKHLLQNVYSMSAGESVYRNLNFIIFIEIEIYTYWQIVHFNDKWFTIDRYK